MKKTRIGKKMYNVLSPEEYSYRASISKSNIEAMAEDTAILRDGYVYPIQPQYSKNAPGVTDMGVLLRYSHPECMDKDNDYKAENVIDFENIENLQDSIRKQAQLEKEETTILISPDNIFTPVVKESDTPEMKLLKEAITRKHIDLDNYKQRFGSDYNNDKRLFDQNSITFFKLKRLCNILDIKVELSLEDNAGAVNPIGEKLTAQITTDVEEGDVEE